MKVVIFAQEILSVIMTPFVLWYSLPPCAPAIVDFFREFSIHVDGLGYVNGLDGVTHLFGQLRYLEAGVGRVTPAVVEEIADIVGLEHFDELSRCL